MSAITMVVIIIIITDTWPLLGKHFTCTNNEFPPKPYEVSTVIVSIFRMKKLRHWVVDNLPCKEWVTFQTQVVWRQHSSKESMMKLG